MTLSERLACWSARNVLDLHVDGRLTASMSAKVESHLKACAGCLALVDELRPVKFDSEVAVPRGLAEAILQDLEQGTEADEAVAPAWRLAPAQAAAVVYLGLLAAGNAAPGTASQGIAGKPGLEALR